MMVVTHLDPGQRVRLYSLPTGEVLSESEPAGLSGQLPVALPASGTVFCIVTHKEDGFTGCAASPRYDAATASGTYDWRDWRDRPRQGKYTVTYDDGNGEVYANGRMLFKEFGLKIVHPVITQYATEASVPLWWDDETCLHKIEHGLFGWPSGRPQENPPEMPGVTVMPWDWLRALKADGHRIGSHTRTHRNLSQISTEDRDYEISQSKQDIIAEGCEPDEWWFVAPYGVTGGGNTVIAAHYDWARVGNGYSTIPPADRVMLGSMSLPFPMEGHPLDWCAANNRWRVEMRHILVTHLYSEELDAYVEYSGAESVAETRSTFAYAVSSDIALDWLPAPATEPTTYNLADSFNWQLAEAQFDALVEFAGTATAAEQALAYDLADSFRWAAAEAQFDVLLEFEGAISVPVDYLEYMLADEFILVITPEELELFKEEFAKSDKALLLSSLNLNNRYALSEAYYTRLVNQFYKREERVNELY